MRKRNLNFCILFDESQICKNSLPLRRPRCGWVDNIKMDMERQDGVIRTGLIWLRIGIGGGLF
jgi:hypothetical protein